MYLFLLADTIFLTGPFSDGYFFLEDYEDGSPDTFGVTNNAALIIEY